MRCRCVLNVPWTLLILGPLGFGALFAVAAAEPPAETRTWTSADGKFHLPARLVEAGKETVVLEKENGTRVTVRRTRLSQVDLDYLAQRAAAESVRDQPPAQTVPQPALTVRTSKSNIPGADNPNAFTANDFRRCRLEYGTRIYRDAYLKVGKKDPAWDAAALAVLDAVARFEAYRDASPGWAFDKPSEAQLHALAAVAREKGCDDPLVFSIYARTLATLRWSPAVVQTATDTLDKLRQRHYPPVHVATLAAAILTRGGNQEDKTATAAILDSLEAAACATDYQGVDLRFVLKSTQDDLAPVPGGIHRLAIRLVARKDADPWLASILMGEVELVLGIRARNPDRFAAILHERPQDPRVHWQAAEKLFIKAWLLHRNYPEPAALMMPLIDLAAGPDKMVQFWFQRATAAQFDWIPAYDEMAAHLRKQGDENALYAFAVECLKSGRYDTEIPWRFLVYIDDIASRTQSCASCASPTCTRTFASFSAAMPKTREIRTCITITPWRRCSATLPITFRTPVRHWTGLGIKSTGPCSRAIRVLPKSRSRGPTR